MDRTLGPRNAGDILKETFTIYKNNFWRLIAIVSIVTVPFAVALIILFSLLMPMYGESGTETPSPFLLPILITVYFAFFAVSVLMIGAFMHAVAQQYFNQPISIGRAYGFAWRRMRDMFGAIVLVCLATFGIYLAAILISITISAAIDGTYKWLIVVAIAGTLILVVAPAIIYFGTIWSFISQTALLEGCGPTSALSHSSALVRGSWWRVLGILFLLLLIVQTMYMIMVMIFYIPAMIGAISATISAAEASFPTWLMVVIMILAFIGNIIFMPIYTIGHTLLYFDLRVRKQGYNLDALAGELGLPGTAAEATVSPPE